MLHPEGHGWDWIPPPMKAGEVVGDRGAVSGGTRVPKPPVPLAFDPGPSEQANAGLLKNDKDSGFAQRSFLCEWTRCRVPQTPSSLVPKKRGLGPDGG